MVLISVTVAQFCLFLNVFKWNHLIFVSDFFLRHSIFKVHTYVCINSCKILSKYYIVWPPISLPSVVDGHLDYFYFLDQMNNDAISTFVKVILWTHFNRFSHRLYSIPLVHLSNIYHYKTFDYYSFIGNCEIKW